MSTLRPRASTQSKTTKELQLEKVSKSAKQADPNCCHSAKEPASLVLTIVELATDYNATCVCLVKHSSSQPMYGKMAYTNSISMSQSTL